MPLDPNSFTPMNPAPDFSAPSSMEYFTLTAPPNTTITRKLPLPDTITAPLLYTWLRHPFVVAEVTVSAHWDCEWDQAGLIIFNGVEPGGTPSPPYLGNSRSRSYGPGTAVDRRDDQREPGKWVKAGAQFTGGRVQASSVVATAEGSDWCLAPLFPPLRTDHYRYEHIPPPPSSPFISLRIKFERVGSSLWVWYQQPSGQCTPDTPTGAFFGDGGMLDIGDAGGWTKLREVTGFFAPGVGGLEDKFVWIGVYASRPFGGILPVERATGNPGLMWERRNGASITSRGLGVEFEDLEIF